MSVDTSSLRASVLEWSNRAAGQALDDMRQQTRDRAPFGVSEDTNAGPHILDTEVATIDEEGEQWRGTLAYTADHASYQDDGTGPHLIEGNPLLSFMFNGQRVIVHSVQHPGSTVHRGWFSDAVTDQAWGEALTNALTSEVAT